MDKKTGLVESKRQITRIASHIRNRIMSLYVDNKTNFSYDRNIQNIRYTLDNIDDRKALAQKAYQNKWLLAAKKIQYGGKGSVVNLIETVADNIQRIKESILELYAPSQMYVPSFLELVKEIQATKTTFPSLSYRDKVLSIKTNNIVLSDGDIELGFGEFSVEFNLDRKFHSSLNDLLTIKALNPNYPGNGDRNITHPHVHNATLCAGDGHYLICEAIKQGRVEDAFKLVLSILNNYNEDSPYLSLQEWEHEYLSCAACGYDELTEDCSYSCSRCDTILCENCCSTCDNCSESICMECASVCDNCSNISCDGCSNNEVCSGCDNRYCDECMKKCGTCGSNKCEDCITSCDTCSTKMCEDCQKECDECGEKECEDCLIKCENCNKDLCSTCNDEDKCNMFKEVKV
jgi:hypothetical protein